MRSNPLIVLSTLPGGNFYCDSDAQLLWFTDESAQQRLSLQATARGERVRELTRNAFAVGRDRIPGIGVPTAT